MARPGCRFWFFLTEGSARAQEKRLTNPRWMNPPLFLLVTNKNKRGPQVLVLTLSDQLCDTGQVTSLWSTQCLHLYYWKIGLNFR